MENIFRDKYRQRIIDSLNEDVEQEPDIDGADDAVRLVSNDGTIMARFSPAGTDEYGAMIVSAVLQYKNKEGKISLYEGELLYQPDLSTE